MSEKLSNLRAVADKTETFSYMQRFTSDEIAEMKDQIVLLDIGSAIKFEKKAPAKKK